MGIPAGFSCADDGYYSVVSFTAYGSVPGRQEVRSNNAVVSFNFTLAPVSTAGLSRIVVQICRFPLPITTQPPTTGYCGPAVTYAPAVYDPPPPRV